MVPHLAIPVQPAEPQLVPPRGRLVWRSWVIAPDQRNRAAPVLLTGVFGFPWQTATLDAKCTIRDRDHVGIGAAPQSVDRHHRVIPARECTCGIYASDDLAATPAADLFPVARPVATGFVSLEGAIVSQGSTLRAQRATIVGPLTVEPGRPTSLVRLLARSGRPSRPATVVAERDGYRVTWGSAKVGVPFAEWKAWTSDQIAGRYGVRVG